MRQSNFSIPWQNKAALTISATNYDRRALDCTDTLPLVNSLRHLSYLTAISARTREMLTSDGGLERLLDIVKEEVGFTSRSDSYLNQILWQLSFQCIINIGIRGSEKIRACTIKAGVVPIIYSLLEDFLNILELHAPLSLRSNLRIFPICEIQRKRSHVNSHIPLELTNYNELRGVYNSSFAASSHSIDASADFNQTAQGSNYSRASSEISGEPLGELAINSIHEQMLPYMLSANHQERRAWYSANQASQNNDTSINISTSRDVRDENRPESVMNMEQILNNDRILSELYSLSQVSNQYFFANRPREEDILCCLQILAYISKYPKLRHYFTSTNDCPSLRTAKTNTSQQKYNVFQLIENFTLRYHPAEFQYWAGIVMRNSCRKDKICGGIRQCANLECGKWEEFSRQFAKCRRCRLTKYCSKACQSRAWAGHRWWCRERNSHESEN